MTKNVLVRLTALVLTLLAWGLGLIATLFLTLILMGSQLVDCPNCLAQHWLIPAAVFVTSLAAGVGSFRVARNPELSKFWLVPPVIVISIIIVFYLSGNSR